MAQTTFKDRLVRVGILAGGGNQKLWGLFMGGLYVSYRYFQIKKFEADFKEIIKDK